MLNSLKKLFKNNTKLIKISDSIYSDKKIYCFAELYEKLGLDKYIEQMKKSNEFDKYHVDNIRCNSKTYDKNCDERLLKDIVKKVIKKFFVRRKTSKQSDNVKIE